MMISFYNKKILNYGIFVVTHKPCVSKKSWLISERIREHNNILWVKQSVHQFLWQKFWPQTLISYWQPVSPSSYAHKFLSRENFKGEYARIGKLKLEDSILSIDILQGMRSELNALLKLLHQLVTTRNICDNLHICWIGEIIYINKTPYRTWFSHLATCHFEKWCRGSWHIFNFTFTI